MIVCMKNLPHRSHSGFLRFWLEEHGPIVRRNAKVRRTKRYTQIHLTGGRIGGNSEPSWPLKLSHEKQFLDLPNLEFFLGTEHVFHNKRDGPEQPDEPADHPGP
jgi:hypothetical protein